jgi:hypothetical protein
MQAERIAGADVSFYELLIDDYNSRSAEGISRSEVAAGDEGNSHGLKEAGQDGVEERVHIFAGLGSMAFDVNGVGLVITGEDGNFGGARGGDARKAA